MYERIVVPLDGSELAATALPHARELARLTGAPIHLVRVVDVTHPAYYGPYGMAAEYAPYDQLVAAEQTAALDYLTTVQGDLGRHGVAVTIEARKGSARNEITAATQPGDLIVMASHGRTGMPRWFLGSIAEEVVRHATVPVLLVRAMVVAVRTDPLEAIVPATTEPVLAAV